MSLELKNITKSYDGDKIALNNFSVKLEPGIHALLGVNGAGKSTLLNILSGNLAADRGKIIYKGQEIGVMRDSYLSELGYLPQYPDFYPDFTLEEILQYFAVLKNLPEKSAQNKIDYLIKALNLEDYRNYKIRALSGGSKQRVGIAQALLNDPEILILDEPTSGLDPLERIRFRNLLSSIADEKIIILATHIVSDAASIADNILLISRGRLIKSGSNEELCAELKGRVRISELDKSVHSSAKSYNSGNKSPESNNESPESNNESPESNNESVESQVKSFRGTVDDTELLITQVLRKGSKTYIRTVGEKILPGALSSKQVDANLDDVFLYYAGAEKYKKKDDRETEKELESVRDEELDKQASRESEKE